MLALCASLGLPAGCHLRLRQAAARAVAAEWRADPEGDGAAMALSLQGPNAPLLQSADEYLSAALQPGFFLCEAELKAVADLLGVSIYITRVEAGMPDFEFCVSQAGSVPLVRLLHVGGNHYMALVGCGEGASMTRDDMLLRLMPPSPPPLPCDPSPSVLAPSAPAAKAPGRARRRWRRALLGRRCSHPVAPGWWKATNTATHGGFVYRTVGCAAAVRQTSARQRKTRRCRRGEARAAAQDSAAKQRRSARIKFAAEWQQIRWGLQLRQMEGSASATPAHLGSIAPLVKVQRMSALRNKLRGFGAGIPQCPEQCLRYASGPTRISEQRSVLTLAEIRTLLAIGCVERNPGPTPPRGQQFST
jgi:hypothetical protein